MLESGQIINQRYQLQQQLGSNPIRVTWLATDLETQEVVVVKLLCFGGNVQWDELKLFEREAQILKQLQHPRIPKYRDYFSIDESTLWFGLVQEYIPGNNLKDLLTQGKRFSETEIKTIATQILEILRYLHGLNPPLLHRDIKPSNLIMGEDNHIYVVDFGAVQDQPTKEGVTFTVVGTYGYAPIEQFSGKTVPASDLYALGVTLIHLLTGVTPAELPTRDLKIQFRHLLTCQSYLLNWLEKITEPSLDKRFKNAKEAREYLEPNKWKTSVITDEEDTLILPKDSKLKVIKNRAELIIFYLNKPSFWGNIFLLFPLIICLIQSWVVMSFSPVFLLLSIPFHMSLLVNLRGIYLTKIKIRENIIIKGNRFILEQLNGKNQSKISETYTKDIQNISVQQNKIIIVTKASGSDQIKKYSFGEDLTETELIYAGQVIRDWLKMGY